MKETRTPSSQLEEADEVASAPEEDRVDAKSNDASTAQANTEGAGDDPPQPDESPIDVQASYDELHDRYLRLAAEFENYKKRAARDWQSRVQAANSDLLLDLLDIVDNFRRALEASDEDSAYAQGVRMIYDQIGALLQRQGVRALEVKGERFDPALHDALLHVESDEHPEGTVCQEIRTGYMRHDRVLRPAQVAVSRGPAKPQEESNEEANRGREDAPE